MALNPLYSSLSHLGKKANGQKGGWGGGGGYTVLLLYLCGEVLLCSQQLKVQNTSVSLLLQGIKSIYQSLNIRRFLLFLFSSKCHEISITINALIMLLLSH